MFLGPSRLFPNSTIYSGATVQFPPMEALENHASYTVSWLPKLFCYPTSSIAKWLIWSLLCTGSADFKSCASQIWCRVAKSLLLFQHLHK